VAVEIGVVGPHDLVDDVAAVCEEQPGVAARRFDYDHESQAPALTEAHANAVDAWLFTGVVPYSLCREAETLTRSATFVDYTGATLLQALVRLVREGHDVTRMSIDTLATADVTATLSEAGIPIANVATLPYRSGVTSADAVAFHRRQRKGSGGSQIALTCLRSVFEALRGEMPVRRLAPSTHAVRNALRQLLLQADNQAQEDAQIAIGLAELPGGDDGLLKEVVSLGGTMAPFTAGTQLLVTTRGPLFEATNGFSGLPMLRRLADRHEVVRLGFGLGRGAAEAESLARRALARARRIGPVVAVLSLRGDTDIVLDATSAVPSASGGEANLSIVSQRVGLSVPTLQRLREVRSAAGAEPLTTRQLADQLGVQQRTARRMLSRLELAGLAERTGNQTSGASGRPLTLYRITL
jgi:hypothetical protein